MADAFQWVVACENKVPFLKDAKGFAEIESNRRQRLMKASIYDDNFISAVVAQMRKARRWETRANLLLAALNSQEEKWQLDKYWPKSAVAAGKKLRAFQPFLEKYGVSITFELDKERSLILERNGNWSQNENADQSMDVMEGNPF
jgi:hypothetical protein